MNAPFPHERLRAERFSVAQIWALIEQGVMNEDARYELLDGEIIPMSPKGPLHEDVRRSVKRWLQQSLPSHLEWMAETTLYLDDHSFVEPDFVVFDDAIAIKDLRPADVKLAIEVGDSSWAYDTEDKAVHYARHGIQEYWAIHAPSRMTRVHRGPSASGWAEMREIAAGEKLTPLCAPDAVFVLRG